MTRYVGLRSWTVLLGLALVAGLCGCATVELPPPTAEVREDFGDVELVTLPSEHEIDLKQPIRGKEAGALSGAGQAAMGSLELGADLCLVGDPMVCAFGLAAGIAMAPFAALVGAGIGASKAHTEAEVIAADASLRAVIADVTPHEALRDHVAAAVAEHPELNFYAPKPPAFGATPWDLVNDREDTLLEIDISKFDLASEGRLDPDVTVVIRVRGSLVRTADDTVLYRRIWAYRSEEHSYFDLAADDAQPLRSEIDGGFAKLADKIVFDLFLADGPEVRSAGRGPAGVAWSVATWAPARQSNTPAPTETAAAQVQTDTETAAAQDQTDTAADAAESEPEED